MAENSGIEWCDHTANFWIGCTKVSPACDNCYAERDWSMDGRHRRVEWGPHGSRSPTKGAMQTIRRAQAIAAKSGIRQRVFVNSLSDWADNHPSITSGLRGNIFEAARLHPDVDFLLLTKRPQNIGHYLPGDWRDGYPNVWLGTTVENQAEAARRIPHLLSVPARVHFLSCEPLLGPVDLTHIDLPGGDYECFPLGIPPERLDEVEGGPASKIDWIICGGESGPGARPMHTYWARSLRDQCKAAGVPFFFKQWGEWAPDTGARADGSDPVMEGARCAVWSGADWQFYENGYVPPISGDLEWMYRVGKKRAGRLLDGVTHDEFPQRTRNAAP